MPAELIPSPGEGQPHLLKLPRWQNAGDLAAEVGDALLLGPHLTGPLTLQAGDWPLRIADYQALLARFEPLSLSLAGVCCLEAGARVAAAALGLQVSVPASLTEGAVDGSRGTSLSLPFAIHQGTLRSGEHRQASGSLLVLGDVNPGAQIQAEGHVLVWGKLRGIAHAGCSGDRSAMIVALHLRPLQLRIADQVARGPEEEPPLGLAEQAHLVNGVIQIDPAEPRWPLLSVPAQRSGPSAVGSA
ncbi:MAG: septum site-determining protein MinC [Cyanobium sp.]|jgi:septum site-determining protein MinC